MAVERIGRLQWRPRPFARLLNVRNLERPSRPLMRRSASKKFERVATKCMDQMPPPRATAPAACQNQRLGPVAPRNRSAISSAVKDARTAIR